MGKKREGKSLFTVVGSRKGRAEALTHPGGAQHTEFLFSQGHLSFEVLSFLAKSVAIFGLFLPQKLHKKKEGWGEQDSAISSVGYI